MLPRCGRAAHVCEANEILQFVFPAAIAFLKLSNSQFDYFYEASCKFRQGNGAIAARWQTKAGVEPPFVGRERPFFLRGVFSITSRRQLKSFSVQQFFKNVGEVWASSPHLRSKSKLHNQMQSVSQGHRFFPNHAENPLQYH